MRDLLYVRRFTLARGFRNEASPARAMMASGTIVVIEADPALTIQRDGPGPVLYAGAVPVHVLNRGGSGRLIGLIHGNVDLASVPLWFSGPDRSARDAAPGAPLASVGAAGIRPFSREKLRGVTRPAAAAVNFSSLLRGELADLILRFSPGERDLADGWRRPIVQPARRNSAAQP